MKDERMAILDMLNRGVITAAEAKELLKTLQGYETNRGRATNRKKDFSETVNTVLNKAEDAFESILDTVEEQYDKVEPTLKKTYQKVQPKVKDIADIVTEKVEDMEPLIKGTAAYFSNVIDDVKSEIDEVRKKYSEKKDEKMGDIFDGDAEEIDLDDADFDFDDDDFEDDFDDDFEDELGEDAPRKKGDMSEILNTLNSQLHELNDAESFLRSAFGEDVFDYDDEDDDSV